MNYKDVLIISRNELSKLTNSTLEIIEIKKPNSISYAKKLAKIVSKLSPLIGNLIEFSAVDMLNQFDWKGMGGWIRQDPAFPDALFQSDIIFPNPGIEIKAWFPLSTEITARFKDSVTFFKNGNIDVALIAWIPEHIIWGKPKIMDILVISGESVARARDLHYHNPPSYIVIEPEDTSNRTFNLQQTNTNGYKLQEDKCNVEDAIKFVKEWNLPDRYYNSEQQYQSKLRELYSKFIYRLDTNYAKIDRIEHEEIEKFKTKVQNIQVYSKTIQQWNTIFNSKSETVLEKALADIL